jgi:hypothetical protein
MGFKKLPGSRGMIYVPEADTGRKKHPCPDCFSCQWCSNERCRACNWKPLKVTEKTKTDPEDR